MDENWVINERDSLDTPERLRFALERFFDSEWKVRACLELLGEEIPANLDQLMDSIREKIETSLVDCSNQVRASYLDLLKTFYERSLLTERNRNAYSARGLKNPYNREGNLDPAAVTWPNPVHPNRPRTLYDSKPTVSKYALIKKDTAIVSAGSCFAAEISHYFQKNGFNYLVKEKGKLREDGTSRFSANWGIQFNPSSLRLLLERHLLNRDVPPILWSVKQEGTLKYFDPFREDVVFDSLEDYEEDRENHHKAAREALLETEVLILTLGLNETWTLSNTDLAFSRCPWRVAPHLVEQKILKVAEVVDELVKIRSILDRKNPGCKLILSVSPVPLHATYQSSHAHVIEANCYSKSTLRSAVEEFVQGRGDSFYFPSYESVMYCTQNPWAEDYRHVSAEAISKVMNLFEDMFLVEE